MSSRFPHRPLAASLLALALGLTGLTACAPQSPSSSPAPSASTEAGWPRQLEMYDNAGQEVTQKITAPPQRVVVIGQNLAELMIAFGVQDRIVGIGYLDGADSYYKKEVEALPHLSDQVPSAEAVMALQPDLIVAMSFAMTDENLGTVATWNGRGVPVLTADNYTIGRDLEAYFADIQNIGTAFDVADEAGAYVTRERATLDGIRKATAAAGEKPRVLLVASGGSNKLTYNYYSPSLGLVDEMVEAAGGEYIEVSKETYAEMSAETIISVDPDVILMTQFQKASAEAERSALIGDERLSGVKAIAKGRVMMLDYATAVRGTPHLGELTRDLAAFLHPGIELP